MRLQSFVSVTQELLDYDKDFPFTATATTFLFWAENQTVRTDINSVCV